MWASSTSSLSLVKTIRSFFCSFVRLIPSAFKSAESLSISMTISDLGEITIGRVNNAWAASGSKTSASTSGQTTGPPAE